MILRTVVFFSVVFLFFLSSCASEHSEIVLAKYGDKEIKMDEFEKAYAKNAGGFEQAKLDSLAKLRDFLNLYVNFKMKLRDAYVRNYDNDSSLRAELQDYKGKVGVTYLEEKYLVAPAVKELYDRRKWEYRVSHIMFRHKPGKDDEVKTLAAAVLDSIKNGASFEEIAKRYSEDAYSKPSGGDIYYITAGLVPVEFEDAVYKTEMGQVYPELVRTRFGYHLIKVTDKNLRIPKIRVSHILVDFKNDSGVVDTAAARAKIDSVLMRLKAGEDFGKLASEYSEDPGSKQNGGDLGYFARRAMVKEFDEAAFKLEVGQISDVVQTNYGFHIIKLTDKQPYPTFDEDRENLKDIFQKQRYNTARANFVDTLRAKYNYNVNDSTLNYVLSKSDSVKLDENHPAMKELKDMPLFSYAGKNITFGEFVGDLTEKKDFYSKIITKDILDRAVKAVSEDYLLKEEAAQLEKTDPEYKSLMKDYKNGIFIFKLQEDEVWNRIRSDSSSLYQYYLNNKENYKWPDRVSFVELFSKEDSLINYYYTLLQNGADFDSLTTAKTERTGVKEKLGNYPLDDVEKSPLYKEASKLENLGDYSEPFKTGNGFAIVKLVGKDPARLKTFKEARAEVAGAFQESESKRLEQEYVESLKKRYEPVFFYSELEKAYKENQ
jgi:peptidyl-prolyl cis-trans isomerase SurA